MAPMRASAIGGRRRLTYTRWSSCMMKQTRRPSPMSWLYRCGVALGGLGWLSGVSAPVALAQDDSPSKASCARAYESAQESRAAGQLQETLKRLSRCARPECPSFVQKDCSRWLEEVDRELPSVVVQAQGLAPDDAPRLVVKIDGNAVVDPLGGAAVPLDPGRHELIAESPGRPSISRVIVAQQGVQKRPVTLDFGPLSPPAPSPDVALDVDSGGSQLRPYAYVAWGIGAVGLGTFAVLGTLGRADENALKDDCPNATTDSNLLRPGVCLKERSDERKSIYQREFVLADVGLVTGIVGAAAGTVLFILSATDSSGPSVAGDPASAAMHLDVSPAPGGGYASVTGAF
jgi:hypothetical protein